MVKTVRFCDRCGAEIPDRRDRKMSIHEVAEFYEGDKMTFSCDLCEHCTFLFSEYFIKGISVPGRILLDEFCEKELGLEGGDAE